MTKLLKQLCSWAAKKLGLQTVNNHSTVQPFNHSTAKQFAFTLAEVLITLAIIGVVAALTIPTLVQNYKKRAVETKLLKIYSTMNQAIKLSTVDNGETETWEGIVTDFATYEGTLALFNRYLAPYLRHTKVKQENDTENLLVYLPDGTALSISNTTVALDIDYYTEPKCLDNNNCKMGVNDFPFRFQPKHTTENQRYKYTVNPGIEPYMWGWDGTIEGAKHNNYSYGCYDNGALCTKLIQLNNWKIPDDYPYKF